MAHEGSVHQTNSISELMETIIHGQIKTVLCTIMVLVRHLLVKCTEAHKHKCQDYSHTIDDIPTYCYIVIMK